MKIFSIHRTDSPIFFFITRLFWNSRQKKLVNHGIEGKVCTHTRLKRRRDIINFPINSVFILYLYISWNEIKKRYLQFRIKIVSVLESSPSTRPISNYPESESPLFKTARSADSSPHVRQLVNINRFVRGYHLLVVAFCILNWRILVKTCPLPLFDQPRFNIVVEQQVILIRV